MNSGFTAATCLYIAYAAKKYRPIAWPIVIGGGIRLLVAWVVGLRLYPVPGSTGDVVGFEKLAATWSQLPWPSLIGKLDPTQSDFYVGVGASTTAVTTAVIVHALPSGFAAANSGTAKLDIGAFVASPTNEAHGTGPVDLAIDISRLVA
ncbi:hypothetical protein P1P91_00110 [Halomonas piscis]|uniref:Uncharacterized protein n=1 Tax=Halomonas piscis TaxID=3031727 RepID=A0ABY9Z0M4_9GAMM|nr:hypothetical protein [Halomonas piscis]WNK20140.1 hypothetical protein P1P91_00110 [Halomonas piscis]